MRNRKPESDCSLKIVPAFVCADLGLLNSVIRPSEAPQLSPFLAVKDPPGT